MTAKDIIEKLKLRPLPHEGGWFAENWASRDRDATGRPHGTSIYFLVTEENFSAFHRLSMEEVYHFYAGDPVEHVQLKGGSEHRVVLGSQLARGDAFTAVVAPGVWQATRIVPGGRWALMACVVTPGWDQSGFELADRDALIGSYPACSATIRELTRVTRNPVDG